MRKQTYSQPCNRRRTSKDQQGSSKGTKFNGIRAGEVTVDYKDSDF